MQLSTLPDEQLNDGTDLAGDFLAVHQRARQLYRKCLRVCCHVNSHARASTDLHRCKFEGLYFAISGCIVYAICMNTNACLERHIQDSDREQCSADAGVSHEKPTAAHHVQVHGAQKEMQHATVLKLL